MTRITRMVVMCAAVTVVTVQVQAETIGQLPIYEAGGTAEVLGSLHLYAIIEAQGPTPLLANLFDVDIYPSMAGTTLSMSPGVEFDNAVNLLTNGMDDIVETYIGIGGITGNEFNVFGTTSDFSGYHIDAIELEIFSLFLDTPGMNINGNGIWTDYMFDGNLIIVGGLPVPEAATGALLALGLAGLAGRRSRQALHIISGCRKQALGGG